MNFQKNFGMGQKQSDFGHDLGFYVVSWARFSKDTKMILI